MKQPLILLAVMSLAAVARADSAVPAPVAPMAFTFDHGTGGWSSATDGVQASLAPGLAGQALKVDFKGKETGICLKKSLDLSKFRAVKFDAFLPDTRAEMRVLLYFVDEDDFWYQSWQLITPEKGKWKPVEVDIRPGSGRFLPMGHSCPWNPYAAREVKEFGIRVFADRSITGAVSFDNITLLPGEEEQPPQAVLNFETSSGEVPRYKMFEVTFELSRAYDNPFDPDQILVSATFSSPSGRQMTAEGFFYQEFERRRNKRVESLIPVGAPKWKIRFSPTEAGEWSYEITIKDSEELRLPPRKFLCIPSESHGYVQVSSDKRYFEFEDGSFFYPIGHNIPAAYNSKAADTLGLTLEKQEGTLAYDRYLAGMQKAGENYARIWMAVWSFGLEWSRKPPPPRDEDYHPNYRGVGRYNMQNAWRLDYVLQQAERRDIHLQLALATFGQFKAPTGQPGNEGDWAFSPYNVANGGWLTRPQEFWTDERAQNSYQQMVRYVMARWGYATNVAAWELCNEINLVSGWESQHDNILKWHKRCAETIRKYDPNPHMLTANFSDWERDPAIISLPEISFSSTNNYQVQIVGRMRDNIFPLKDSYGKPAIMAECGYHFQGATPETTEKYLHICLWSSYMTPFAGAGMSWWWDFIDDRDLYRMHTPLVEFARGEDLRHRNLQMSKAECAEGEGASASGLATLTLQNDTSGYFWIYETRMLRAEAEELFVPSLRKNIQLSFRGLKDGDYRVEFWDTVQGGKLNEITARAEKGTLRCPVPEFTGDIAGKIKPL